MIGLLAIVLLLLLAPPAVAKPADRRDALGQWVAILDAQKVPTGWTGSTATCTRGTESAQSIQATLTAVNALRDFAGLAPVTLDPVKNDKALAAALMMDAAGDLSHTPGEDWPCSTADGREAAARSNLALGFSGAEAMVGYVDDSGVESLGHRRWVLDPAAAEFGTGSTGRTNALWNLPDSGSPTIGVGPPVVAWPPEGWIPWGLVFSDWSASMNVEGADVSAAQVSMTVDGQPRAVSNLREVAPGFGSADPTLAWNVALTPADHAADRDVVVSITGVTVNGGPVPVRYTVRAFAAAPPQITRIDLKRPGKLKPGRKLKVTAQIRDGLSTTYQWLRNGKPIAGTTRRAYRISKTDRGKRLRCRVTASGIGTATRLSPRARIPRR